MKLPFSFLSVRKPWVGVLAGIALATGYSGIASATIVPCGEDCTVKITATDQSGTALGTTTGSYTIDPKTGAIDLSAPISINGSWGSATIDTLGGNSDPSLLFGGGSVNNSGGDVLFSFVTSTPISLHGPVVAQSQLNYGLTSQVGFGPAHLEPFDTGHHLVVANDLQLGNGTVNKGVDIGGPCDAAAGKTVTCGNLSLTGAPFGSPGDTFTAMGINVSYFLSAHSSTSFNGQVVQVAVPEPSTYTLLVAGLGLIGFVARRRINS
jgi:hypothetical protein